MIGLPAQARVAVDHDAALEAGVAVQPRHGGVRDHARGEPAVGDQRAQDQRHRRGRVLTPDLEQELALLGREVACAAPVGAWRRAQPGEPVGTVGVQPALERRHAEVAQRLAAGRQVALGGQRT
jgi:hypothetical protein